jgi:hypothetical protein
MSPEDAGKFGDYCQYRHRGEDEVCTALRMHLSETDASEFEASFRQAREGRAAA